jgi:anti-sigma factor RsiW
VDCGDVIKQLNSYLDGELDETLRWELLAHLEKCQDCRVVVDTTRKTIELYCNSEPLPLPDDVRQRLNQALARKLTGRAS